MDMQDILTIVGAVIGLIAGSIFGSFNVYSKMNKANLIGILDNSNHPSNLLSTGERVTFGAIGGLFFTIGLLVAFFSFISKPGEYQMLIVFGGICMAIGGLVCVPAITGKKS